MSRVLLTGATGFVGRNVLERFRTTEHELHVVALEEMPVEKRVTWHRADLLSSDSLGAVLAAVRPTHLVHLAWYAVHQQFWTGPENLRWVGATLDLVRQFATHGGRRVVGLGSCAEYDWAYSPCIEGETPLNPRTLYGACKHAAHVAAAAYARQSDVELVWGRLFSTYGSHEHPTRFVASIIRSVLAGEPATCTHGQLRRDFLEVGDVARSVVGLCDANIVGAVNVASGELVTLGRLAVRVGELTGRPELVTVHEKASGDPVELAADVTRLRSLGLAPNAKLDDGLKNAIAWWSTELNRKEETR